MRRVPPIVIIVAVLGWTATLSHAATTKLDPTLRLTLARLAAGQAPAQLASEGASVRPNGMLNVFIRGEVSRAELEAQGVRVRTALPGIYTADVPVDAIDRVAAMSGVERIVGSVRAEPELDVSVPTTNANLQRLSGPTFAGANGAGVLVGSVDTGVSYQHGDFKDPDDHTRFVAIWDQTISGTPPSGYAIGRECSQAEIEAGTCPQTAPDGHGTHVLGIAAGDGSQTGGTVPAYTYVGMAPRADLVTVKTTFDATDIVDGVAYIFGLATSRSQNAVVNLSLGSQQGPHDGTSPFESALDALTGPGRIIVKSAGNNRADNMHDERIAGAGDTVATAAIAGSQLNRQFAIDGYYESTENMLLTIMAPDGTTIGPLTRGTRNSINGVPTPSGTVYAENGFFQTSAGDYEVFIYVIADVGQTMNGTWSIHFTPQSLGAANGEVDMWLYARSAGLTANFVQGVQADELISEPGNAEDIITVASWVSRKTWIGCNGQAASFTSTPAAGSLAPYSSPGPTRDGRSKPDIAAPGTAIGSARSLDTFANCPSLPNPSTLLPDGSYHIMNTGTSMAAPHATGAAALLMQKYGAMTPTEIKNHFTAFALTDGNTGPVWNESWGYGKLRLGDLVDPSADVLSPNGGESYEIGTTATLTWLATDSYGGVTEVDILLSRNGPSGPFETLALSEPNDGTFDWTVTGPGTDAGGSQMYTAYLKVVARDDAGNTGEDVSNAGFSIFDPVATVLALFQTTTAGDAIELRWQFGEPGTFSATHVERADQPVGPWERLTGTAREEDGVMVFVDDDVVAGRTYHYRLVAETQDGASFTFGPLSAVAGGAITDFALEMVSPNPTPGTTRIDYTVPRAGPLRLAIVDVQGREVAVLAEGAHQPGRYQAVWSGEGKGRPAPAGLYFVSFDAPGRHITQRLALVR